MAIGMLEATENLFNSICSNTTDPKGCLAGLTQILEEAHKDGMLVGVVSENGIYGHSRFCNTDFDDKLACLNLSG
ncbi:hypothetical protein NF328_21820, partial [Enterobacter hormaechei]|nr:hypothetical protein [Enterobacter hormaechei]